MIRSRHATLTLAGLGETLGMARCLWVRRIPTNLRLGSLDLLEVPLVEGDEAVAEATLIFAIVADVVALRMIGLPSDRRHETALHLLDGAASPDPTGKTGGLRDARKIDGWTEMIENGTVIDSGKTLPLLTDLSRALQTTGQLAHLRLIKS